MAGLWERVKPDGTERINIHLIVAGLRGYFVNTVDSGKGATQGQVLSAINSQLTASGYSALDAAEQTDLSDIAAELDLQSTNTAKLIYLCNLEYVMIAAEVGEVAEAKWRNDLGIV